MTAFIREQLRKVLRIVSIMESDAHFIGKIEQAGQLCIEALKAGGKILFAGNGGSAADAQHLAAEIVVRLRFNRPALSAMALTTDTSILTAVSNDIGFEHIFARQIEGLAQPNDVFVAISTSGKSPNILKAIEVAQTRKIKIIGMTGAAPTPMDHLCDLVLNIPDKETSKIQECHIMIGHILCEMIEDYFYNNDATPQISDTQCAGIYA